MLWHFQLPVPGQLAVLVQQRARQIADGFQIKWMLQQMCQCERNDVWERTESVLMRGLLHDKGFFLLQGRK